MNSVGLRIKRLPHCHSLPQYATAGSAGLDLAAAIEDSLELAPGQRARVPVGIEIEVPPGHQAQVVPRSGLADKLGITLTNCVGTIDSDYRGEVQVLLINHGDKAHVFKRGDRIAQLVIIPIPRIEVIEVKDLAASARDRGGFGSTGLEQLPERNGQR